MLIQSKMRPAPGETSLLRPDFDKQINSPRHYSGLGFLAGLGILPGAAHGRNGYSRRMGEIVNGSRMSSRGKSLCLMSLVIIFFSANLFPFASEEKEKTVLKPKLISLDPGAKEYMRILGGPPETVTMRSGLVVLEPGTSVGKHNTKNYEEVLVVLEGGGEMMITDGPTLKLKAGSIAYCPPRTEHDVTCTGSAALKYVYIVANAE